MEHIFTIN